MKTSNISRGEKIIESKKNKARSISLFEGSAYAASDGFGLRNIAPYALALNASNSMMGLLTSIPSLLGNLSQLLTYKLLRKNSRKKVVISGVFLQTFFWLLLLIPGILFLRSLTPSNKPIIILISLYSALVISGSIINPAWSSWMKDLIPKEQIGRYFARRSKISGVIIFTCMLLAGFLLDYFKRIELLYGFFILIFLSFFFRGISGFLFFKKYEPPFKESKKSYFSLIGFIKNMPFNNFGRFVIFIALINLSVAIASPFFAVYLLRNKSFSYTSYMALMLFLPLSGILAMNFWGRLSDKWGNVNIMRVTTISIIIIPLIYFISSFFKDVFIIFMILLPIEILGGISWAGFNLSASNFVFRTVSRERMVICSSYMNVINGISIFIGASLGGFLASLNFWNPILAVFLISSLGRFLAYLTILPKLKEKASKKSRYDSGDFISHLMPAQRLFNSMGDIIYFKRTINSIQKSKLGRFF